MFVHNRLYFLSLAAVAFAGMAGGLRAEPLTGTIQINGSSTVAPVMIAASEMFGAVEPRVRVPVGISGTGGGFKKFLEDRKSLRTDINDASRPVSATELARAKSLGVEFIELPIAMDGVAVVVHPQNKFCDHLTVEELRRVWEPGSKVQSWKDIRPSFPDLPIKLYGPGPDSGTFDYFTEAVCGKEKASRNDYTASENDNVLVQGISGDAGSLGYFGFSYYEANKSKLKLLGVDHGDGKPVTPNVGAIRSGEYTPLARPLFIYVNRESADRAEVRAFVEFFFANAAKIVEHKKVNYVALDPGLYSLAKARFDQRVTGSLFVDRAHTGPVDLMALYGGR